MLKDDVYEEEIKEIKNSINKIYKIIIVSIIVSLGMFFFLLFELIDPYWI